MPGGRLSKTEESLVARWDQPNTYPFPLLRAVSLDDATSLRGIRDVRLELRYPLTVLIGRNGIGKSTLLALAALAFHSPPGHVPINTLRRPSGKEPTSYYTFSDFFFRGPGDASSTGVGISWEYSGRPQLTIQRRSDKWMRYERRPRRPVHFVGIARTVPAIERRVLRAHFPPSPRSVTTHELEPPFVQHLSRITGLPYEGAQVLSTDRYQLRALRGRQSYSSFNMGAGEDVLVETMHVLQSAPKGSLIVIEEVELGLHPRAVRELAGVLLEVALARSLQFVVSSHSYDFIDSVPRQARVLLERVQQDAGPSLHLTYAPTTRLAMGELVGGPHPEATIYCEDDFARQLIIHALPETILRRVHVVPVGSESQLVPSARFHAKAGAPGKALLVWDGDTRDGLINGWFERDEPRVPWTRLPGASAPERWVAGMLSSEAGADVLARYVNADPDRVRAAMEQLRELDDPHDLAWRFGTEFCRGPEEARTILLLAVKDVAWDDLAGVRDAVTHVLDGTTA